MGTSRARSCLCLRAGNSWLAVFSAVQHSWARDSEGPMDSRFDHPNQARVALAAIVADPEFGPAALSDPAALSNLLSDYLPDSPRETGPLLAAAQADVPGTLHDHVGHGMDPATAIRITASNLASRTAF